MRQSLAEWISQRAGMHGGGNGSQRLPKGPESELDRYRERVNQLLSIASQQASELASERSKRLSAEQAYRQVRSELRDSEKERRNLKRTLRRVSRELNSFRRGSELPAITELGQQLDRLRKQAVGSLSQEQDLRVQAEAKAKTLQKEVVSLKQALAARMPSAKSLINARVEQEREKRRKAEKERKNLKRELKHTNRSLDTLRGELSKHGRQSYVASSNGAVPKGDFIRAVLPNLTLARDGDVRLMRARETKQIFDDLMRLNDSPHIMRGERMGSVEPWLEIRPTRTDRVYYRKGKGRGQYLVLIGDKNSQENDLAWMRKNN